MTTTSPKRLWAPATATALLVLAGLAVAAPSDLLQTPESPVDAQTPQHLLATLEDVADDLQDEVLAPMLLDYHSIRPGQSLLVTIPGEGTFICTASFIFKNVNTGKVYLGTAGHCVLSSAAVATHGPGANYNAGGVAVRACISQCHFGGQLSSLDTMVNLGPVVYARQTRTAPTLFCPAGDVGNDFGLVEIPNALHGFVQTSMAVWNGPFGSNSVEGTGNPLVHHGSGITAGTVVPTKSRVAVSLNDGLLCSFQAVGHVAGGDSGSAISFGKAAVGTGANQPFGGDKALGTITHGIIGTGSPFYGTTIFQSIQMAKDDASLNIKLCDASTTVATC